MCGIFGLITKRSPIDRDQLNTATTRLAHRGPDDHGIYINGNVGLGQTRLSIIDLAHGHQPMVSDDGYALVANGEIYNYRELAKESLARGRQFATASDSEAILHAYAVDGLSALPRLNGMFAFAIHDPFKRQVIIARDRLGIKPLYYTRQQDRIVFASEIKALTSQLDRTPELRPSALVEFLQIQTPIGRNTAINGINRVLPGEALIIDEQLVVTHHRYWSAKEINPIDVSFEEASEEFSPLIEQVMREHMRSDVPYGVFLSGGVDSATLLALLTQLHSAPLNTYSVGWEGASSKGELDDAERVAKLFGTNHIPIRLTREEIFARIPHMIWSADELMRDEACLPTSFLAERASQDLKVVFTGEGGDEAFAGYGRYRKHPLQRRLKSMFSPGSGGFRTRGQCSKKGLELLLKAELAPLTHSFRQPIVEMWRETRHDWSDVQRSQLVDLGIELPDVLLVKVDRMLMAHGLEGRVPFIDHRIVEFGLSLPDHLKVARGQGKIFLKRWAERYLPHDHLYRKKRGFHVPIGEWFQGEFLIELEQRLLANPTVTHWFKPEGIRTCIRECRHHGNRLRELWSIMQFAIWHRTIIDEPHSTPSTIENPLEWIA